MAGAIYIVVTGSTTQELTDGMATQSLLGFNVFGSVASSGSGFVVLMGKGTGVTTVPYSLEDTSSNLKANQITASATPMSRVIFPPVSSVIVNIDPNNLNARTG